jgi:hypothetical protein
MLTNFNVELTFKSRNRKVNPIIYYNQNLEIYLGKEGPRNRIIKIVFAGTTFLVVYFYSML